MVIVPKTTATITKRLRIPNASNIGVETLRADEVNSECETERIFKVLTIYAIGLY